MGNQWRYHIIRVKCQKQSTSFKMGCGIMVSLELDYVQVWNTEQKVVTVVQLTCYEGMNE